MFLERCLDCEQEIYNNANSGESGIIRLCVLDIEC